MVVLVRVVKFYAFDEVYNGYVDETKVYNIIKKYQHMIMDLKIYDGKVWEPIRPSLVRLDDVKRAKRIHIYVDDSVADEIVAELGGNNVSNKRRNSRSRKTSTEASSSLTSGSSYSWSYYGSSYSYGSWSWKETEKVVELKTKKGTIYAGPCRLVIDVDNVPEGTPVIALEKTYCDRGNRVICAEINDFSVTPVYNIALAVAVAIDALEKHGRVAICCAGGCGRTGMVVSIVKSIVDGVDADTAMKQYSEERGKTCPETSEQEKVVRIVSSLVKRHGLEKTLKLLAHIEKPWIMEVDGMRIRCRQTSAIGLGLLSSKV